MAKVINTILSITDNISKSIQPAINSVNTAKKQIVALRDQIKEHDKAVDAAKENIKQIAAQMEEAKKMVLENNTAYKEAVAGIQNFKEANIEIEKSIKDHQNELLDLAKQYGANSEQYKMAQKELQALKQQRRNNIAAIKDQSENLKRMAENLVENSDEIKSLKQEEEKQKKAIKETSDAAREKRKRISELSKGMAENTEKIKESRAKIKEWGKSFITTIDTVIKRAAQFTVATASLAIGVGLNTSFNLEAYRTQLETAVKDTERTTELIKKAQTLSITTPFTPEEAIKATATLEAYKIDSEKWLSKIADAAGATNKEMEQATAAVKDILSKNEFQGMEEFGISKEMLIEAAQIKYGKNKVFKKNGEVKDQKKLEIVLEEVMTSKFDGGADKLSKTIKGLWSTITGSISMGLAQILGMENGLIKTGSVLDLVREKMKLVADTLVRWQSDGTINKIAHDFTVVFNKIIELGTKAYNFLKENKEVIGSFLRAAAGIYMVVKALMILSGVISAINIILTASPLTWIIAAVLAVIGVLYLLTFHFDLVKAFVIKCWTAFNEFTDNMPLWAEILLLPLKPLIILIKTFGKLIEIASKAVGWIKNLFKDEDVQKTVEVKQEIEEEVKEKAKKDVAQKIATSEMPSQSKTFKKQFEDKSMNFNKAKALKEASNKVPTTSTKKTPAVQVYMQGDIYGMDDFNEKVNGAIVSALKVNMQNVT
ncbi:hypothetical protein C4N20_12405 [Fusobacterium ulcerans]|uniref:ATPase involved in DNA repair n=1 Tax=Fusobacterium ulcerans TaxID=861 RepID=A0AAX2J9M5_9FUSO|nr:hypothetical protein [Fusobacterium ulcerans]AVQ28849.1 hypothetical protein C4N20_12405 [Fusobacterium ulcerans]EFS26332.1 hypothetical protein FUAG_01847 [Fusobacterium ulcerans ATCC 49185]SQJ01001.1 ATPase involved in DNA repair [Fusobacterium ulcerans]